MPVGHSGRIVIEIDPELKQELHATLSKEGVSLKKWFLDNAQQYLREKSQLTLPLPFENDLKEEAYS